jgi:hypothetical protein
MFFQSLLGLITAFFLSSDLRGKSLVAVIGQVRGTPSKQPFCDNFLTSVLLFILVTHLVGTFALDFTLQHTMLLALLPLTVSIFAHSILEPQDNQTIGALIVISVGKWWYLLFPD